MIAGAEDKHPEMHLTLGVTHPRLLSHADKF
jgi:hypothetical protein